jgi:hypothetical protein
MYISTKMKISVGRFPAIKSSSFLLLLLFFSLIYYYEALGDMK